MTTQACCEAGKPVGMAHTDKGTMVKIADMDAYVTGDATTAKAPIIVLYDIFGIDHPQVREVSDRFAAEGYYVVVPDTFRKQPWDLEQFPPPDRSVFTKFLERIDGPVVADIEAVKEHFGEVGLGDKKIGVAGFCWGGKWALTLASDPSFGASFSAHPAFITVEMAEKVVCPVVLCPAKGDVDCVPLVAAMQDKPFADKCMQKRFDDQIHGFCAARGNWDDEAVAKGANEALALATNLFNTTIGALEE